MPSTFFQSTSRPPRSFSRCRLAAAQAQKKYDAGASDTAIKVGQTVPLERPGLAPMP